MSNAVTYELSGGVATITMDDGKVNALSPRMLAELSEAFDRAEAEGAVVLLRGRDGTFSAGFDLSVFQQSDRAIHDMLLAGARLAERVLSFPTPVVVACGGHALAMGAFLLLSADLRIGVEGAYKIGLNEVAIGLTVPHFGIEIARQRLAPTHFNLALTTGFIYAPAQALSAGFFDRLCPAPHLGAVSVEAAVGLSRIDMTAHAATKQRARERALNAVRAAIDVDFSLWVEPSREVLRGPPASWTRRPWSQEDEVPPDTPCPETIRSPTRRATFTDGLRTFLSALR
jgi:enoyl-CoA hydratase